MNKTKISLGERSSQQHGSIISWKSWGFLLRCDNHNCLGAHMHVRMIGRGTASIQNLCTAWFMWNFGPR